MAWSAGCAREGFEAASLHTLAFNTFARFPDLVYFSVVEIRGIKRTVGADLRCLVAHRI